jgi:hypothetical protein
MLRWFARHILSSMSPAGVPASTMPATATLPVIRTTSVKCESARESVDFLDESAVVTLYAASLSALSTSSGHRNLSVLLLPCESINSNGNGHESAPRDNALIVGAKFCDEFVLGTHLQAERTRGRIKLPASHAFGFFYEQVGTPRLFGLLSC